MSLRIKKFFRVIGSKLKTFTQKLRLWHKELTRTKLEMIAELISRRDEAVRRAVAVANGEECMGDFHNMADLMEWVVTPLLYRAWKPSKVVKAKVARLTEMTTYKMIEDIEKISKEVNEIENEEINEEV